METTALRLSRIQMTKCLQIIHSTLKNSKSSLSAYEQTLAYVFVTLLLASMARTQGARTITLRFSASLAAGMELHEKERLVALCATMSEEIGGTETSFLDEWNETLRPIVQDILQKTLARLRYPGIE